jgi:hypothetical protein
MLTSCVSRQVANGSAKASMPTYITSTWLAHKWEVQAVGVANMVWHVGCTQKEKNDEEHLGFSSVDMMV